MINTGLVIGIILMLLWYDVRQSVMQARYYRYYVPFLEKFCLYYWLFSLLTILSYYR